MRVTLRDVTSGHTLLNLTDLDDDWQFGYDLNFGIDYTHVFELELFGRINSWDSNDVEMSSSVRIASVPEAGSPLTLSALAVLGLLVFRKLN
jgi:hypothetical protein